MTLYTDIDPSCCAVLNARVEDDSLPSGDVWCVDVREIGGNDLREYTHVHLFAGMGGSPLGLSWAGWPPEWPIVTAGFPCQDVSSAGKGAGLDGARSGLYREAMRVIELKKPMGCVIENVGALSARGLDRVAGALESLGYWVEALRMGAWAVGSPQERERWWFVCLRADAGEALAGMPHGGCGTRGVRGWDRETHGRRQSGAGGEGSGVAGLHGVGLEGKRLPAGSGRSDKTSSEPNGGGEGSELAGSDCGGWNGWAREQERGSEPRTSVAGAGARSELANLRGRGQGAIGERGAGAVEDEPSAGERVGLAPDAGREGHKRASAGRERLSVKAGDPGRWPHRRHYIIDEHGKERTVPTPQHEWEPPRLFNGTKTISARWRLALMGYPLHWLDVPDSTVAELAGPRYKTPEKRASWWNKQGIAMTGNAQVPQNVAVLAAAAVDAMNAMREERAA